MGGLKTWIILLSMTAYYYFPFVSTKDEQTNYTVCTNNANYSSAYREDVAALLRSLSSFINDTGFYSGSRGGAYAIAMCRADIQLDTCRSCVRNESEGILGGPCSIKFRAIMWNNLCMVRYSNRPMFGILATEPHANHSTDLAFNEQKSVVEVRSMLIEDLRFRAANGGPQRKAAADNRTAPDGETVVYAMVQCTPDLSPEDCANCTADAVRQMSGFSLPWIIFYKPSCFIRFDTDPFYNLTRLQQPLEELMSSSSPGNRADHTKRNIIIIVISLVVFVLVVSFVVLSARNRITKKKKKETTKNDDQISSVESIQYDFGKIRDATNHFSDANKLGQGAFGTVYKGVLENGRDIAVKRLSEKSWQGDREFKNEVLLLAKLQHKNLVRLLGFSLEQNEKLLVYEFVQNGSLDHFIFDRAKSLDLDWDKRYKIIAGIARGLVYLHEDSRLLIIHRDLKASNVLLDEDTKPKISDFGLAKLVMPDEPHDRTSRIVGTPGYMAPEYKSDGKFSIKSDVYSFGILVLEIVTGQKIEDNSGDLISNTWRCWREATSEDMIDISLKDKSGVQEAMLRCIHIALLCIQQTPDKRPTMVHVVEMLNTTSSQTLPSPSEPGFYIPSSFTVDFVSQDM